jgi:bla regulator protein BlaR1
VCMSGVTGSSLRKRIEAIMTNRIGPRLNFGKRLLVSAVGIVALAVPIIIGALSAPPSHAQSQDSPRLQFEAASIKLNVSGQNGVTFSASPGGRLTVVNNPLFNVIDNAYGVRERFLLLGGPDWIDSDRYDIEAKAEGEPGKDQIMKMLQTLLAERFKLTVHREMRELPVYTLTVGKSGPKLTQFKEGSCVDYDPNNPPPAASAGKPHCGNNLIRGGRWEASKTDMPGVTGALSVLVRRKVIDKTGLTGLFDVHIELPPDPLGTTDSSSPSIFTIVQEQLGLKLESDKDLVEVLVIDHVERPSEN